MAHVRRTQISIDCTSVTKATTPLRNLLVASCFTASLPILFYADGEGSEEEDSEASDSEDEYDDGYIKGMGIDMGADDEEGDEDDDEDSNDDSDEDEYTHPSNVLIEEIMDGQIGDVQITAMSAAKVSHADCACIHQAVQAHI